jgi:F-box-like
MSSLSELPFDILVEVFEHLDAKALKNVSLVCKR